MSQIAALIFDMDGVIIDSEPLHLRACQIFLAGHNYEYTEEMNKQFLGRKDIEIAQILIEKLKIPHTPISFVNAKEEILWQLLKEQSQARPGLYDLLDLAKAKNLAMAVASSATMPTIELVVDTLNIRHYFQTLTSGDEVKRGKPEPDVFLLAAKRLGIEPKNCCVIEDTTNGIKAAKAAGMYCIAIPCDATAHQDHSQADIRLNSLAQINLKSLV